MSFLTLQTDSGNQNKKLRLPIRTRIEKQSILSETATTTVDTNLKVKVVKLNIEKRIFGT